MSELQLPVWICPSCEEISSRGDSVDAHCAGAITLGTAHEPVAMQATEVMLATPMLDLLERAHKALDYADPGLVLDDEIVALLKAHGRLESPRGE